METIILIGIMIAIAIIAFLSFSNKPKRIICQTNDCMKLVNYLDIKSKCDAVCGNIPVKMYSKLKDDSILCECEHLKETLRNTTEEEKRYQKLIFG